MANVLSIYNMQEKKEGLGEDSNPISFCVDEITVLGVFDGMGGAGGAECISDFGETHTKAYVASRIVRDAIETFVKANTELVRNNNFENHLQNVIVNRYAKEKEKYPPKTKGGLRSALIKEYPTTLALVTVCKFDNQYQINSYWAGDSRNYIWNSCGLYQITIDDLKGHHDPLQNLHDDAPMSNCIQADGAFTIHHKMISEFKGSDKFIVFSATDGCFGYYQSPMDFERILRKTLNSASSLEEWKNKLTECFASVAADDFSFSVAAFGYDSFKEIKKGFPKNTNTQSYIYNRDKYEREVKKLRKQEDIVLTLNNKLSDEIAKLWPTYKKSYLKYMEDYEER